MTREEKLILFFQFLHAGGRWAEFLRNCPLSYTGKRGSGEGDAHRAFECSQRTLVLRAYQRGSMRRDQSRIAGHRWNGE